MQNLLEISVNHDVHDQCEVRDSNVMDGSRFNFL